MAPERYFDRAVMVRLLDGNQELMGKFAARFIKSAREALEEIDSALANGDMEQLRALGHRTRSAALTVGAIEMAGLCHQLEFLGSDASRAGKLAQDLRGAFGATVAAIEGAGLA